MSAPRWTLARYLDDNRRVLLSADQPVLVLSLLDNHATGRILEAETVARRIVALLNATELSSDAVATLQATCMQEAARDRDLAAELRHGDPEQQQRIATLSTHLPIP